MKICIDAGHGGKDPGALGRRSSREKDIVLDIAKRCAAYAIKLGNEVVLTRDKDIFIELSERAIIANKADADLFVSIHCNSSDDVQANGIETFCYTDSSKGKECAAKVQPKLIKVTGLTNRGVKEARFAVLRQTNMPGILIECGFISNAKEELLLMSEEYRDKVAKSITEAITGKQIEASKQENKCNLNTYYCLEFQKFYNKATKTKAPIAEDGIYGPTTQKALDTIQKLIKGEY